MIDNDIVKALECCMGCACIECPYYRDTDIDAENCMGRLIIEALKLVNRQKAEIERLKDYNENLLAANVGLSCGLLDEIQRARAEAIKEFAERLKERKYQSTEWSHGEHPFVVEEYDIDDVLEEMTEETK